MSSMASWSQKLSLGLEAVPQDPTVYEQIGKAYLCSCPAKNT